VGEPTVADERFGHQLPELAGTVASGSPHWRESAFLELHDPAGRGDCVFVAIGWYPNRGVLDALVMGRVNGRPVLGRQERAVVGEPEELAVPGLVLRVRRPLAELALTVDPDAFPLGAELTFSARTRAYALRRGTLRTERGEVIWDQRHLLQSGVWSGHYEVQGRRQAVAGWLGQRDRSWGIRDHGRCPLWLWLQVQFPEGALGAWHWERADGAQVYTDGAFLPADGGPPVPVVRLEHDLGWLDAEGRPADYGTHGEQVAGVGGTCRFHLADGRVRTLVAEGDFARPYEPFHRGGLHLVRVRAEDGQEGTGIYELTGAHHHRYFPATELPEGGLP
jgi:hypothetical protein